MERGGSSAGPGCTLFVRNIPVGSRVEDVRRLFDRYGHVVDVTLPLDYYSGHIKGYAFVDFEEPRDAEDAARALDRSRFNGNEIKCEIARGPRKTPAEMRERDMRHGREDGDRGYGGGRGGERGNGWRERENYGYERDRFREREYVDRGYAGGGGGGGGGRDRGDNGRREYDRDRDYGRREGREREGNYVRRDDRERERDFDQPRQRYREEYHARDQERSRSRDRGRRERQPESRSEAPASRNGDARRSTSHNPLPAN